MYRPGSQSTMESVDARRLGVHPPSVHIVTTSVIQHIMSSYHPDDTGRTCERYPNWLSRRKSVKP